ncbi:unnamed protein product [Tilletia laevis]|uniref:Uncharacterized protein n=3 Tax=Tilletia TaxID=13289 RepID=A0A8X7SSZ1_9BASI|nr:hypothetical protein CF336_g7919 [Tilletia laevis]KAE8185568.1 hypothetical protein CF328_g7507 [Tilletia controversa]KAE8246897.1 hypothetical protein A4X03_0g7193 [Tilletia caries]KAE8187332.1 hypothetical protein CF335_g7203 [Tilletia laevis]KAE8239473.1 hypothetical protein A4X06_0g8247 [Tilletia controversa]
MASPDEVRDAERPHSSSTNGSGRDPIAAHPVTSNVNFNAQVEHAALLLKLHKAQEFCSRYLDINPYAATATTFGTATAPTNPPGKKLPQTVHVTVTKTAPPNIVTQTTLSVVNQALTATRTRIDVVPTTVTVATITSITTVELPTIVDTVTFFTPAIETVIPRAARPTGTPKASAARITVTAPPYLLGTLPTIISRACSRVVAPKTTTITAPRTATDTIINKASALKATITDEPVVTPTSTLFVPSISTRTVGTVVVPVTETSLSTVPATATDIQPTTIFIPTSTTIYLPRPTPSLSRGYLRIRKVSDDSVIGLVGGQLSVTRYAYSSTPETSEGGGALVVTLPEGWTYGTLMNFKTENGDSTFPQFGGIGGFVGYDFLSEVGYAWLGPVDHADLGAQTKAHILNPQGFDDLPAESQIWILNQDLSVTATWIQPATRGTSAQAVSATVFYREDLNQFGIVNNLDNFNARFIYQHAFAVTFEFVPIGSAN